MLAVAIDGPSSAGKSTIAREAARRLNLVYVDTGALYRAIGYYALSHGADTKDPVQVGRLLKDIDISLEYDKQGVQQVILNGENISGMIRTPAVSMAASDVSAIPAVREFLLELQRDIAKKNNVIMDGRDISTVILPGADIKIFLTAGVHTRAQRRYLELKEKDSSVTFEDVLEDIKKRDYQDSNRKIAPLAPCSESIIIDTSDLDLDEAINLVIKTVKDNVKCTEF